MNTHERATGLAAIGLDFPLSGREQGELDEHLATCPACRREVTDLRADAVSLRTIAAVAPAPRVRTAFTTAVARPDGVATRLLPDLRPYVRLAMVAALLAALMIGLLAVGLVGPGSRQLALRGPSDGPPASPADPIAAALVRRTIAVCPNAASLRPDTDGILLICAGDLERILPGGSSPHSLVGGISDVATTADSIWAVGSDALVRLARTTGLVTARYPAAGGDAVAADDAAVWVARTNRGEVIRVDPATGRTAATIMVGHNPEHILLAYTRVWVTNRGSDSVSVIDPPTNKVVATISVGAGPLGLAAAGGAIWVADNGSGDLSRIDDQTGAAAVRGIGDSRAASATTIPIAPGLQTSDLPAIAAQGQQWIWLVDAHAADLVAVDVARTAIVRRLSVPGMTPDNDISDLAILGDSLWVSDGIGALRELGVP